MFLWIMLVVVLQDPEKYEDQLAACDPPPVSVEPTGKSKPKKRPSGSSKSTSKRRKSASKSQPRSPVAAEAGSERALEVLATFDEKYQDIIKQLPHVLWPSATKHGEHSYTANLVFIWNTCYYYILHFETLMVYPLKPVVLVSVVSFPKPRRIRQARVEVLLRQQALKPKNDTNGAKLTGEAGKSYLVSKQINYKILKTGWIDTDGGIVVGWWSDDWIDGWVMEWWLDGWMDEWSVYASLWGWHSPRASSPLGKRLLRSSRWMRALSLMPLPRGTFENWCHKTWNCPGMASHKTCH